MPERRLVHSAARIRHLQHHIGARLRSYVQAGVRPVQMRVGGSNRELPAFGHGVAGIDRQIHDNLPDLAFVCAYPPQARLQDETQLNVLPDQGPEHLLKILHHHLEVEYLRLEHLLPAERQELPRQCRRSFACRFDRFQLGTMWAVGSQLLR